MDVKGNILVVEPNNGLLTTLDILLKKHFFKVISVSKSDDMYTFLNNEEVDVLVLDLSVIAEGKEKNDLVRKLVSSYPNTELVLLATFAQVETALAGVRAGAFDFIPKPWNNDKLIISIKNAISIKQYKRAANRIQLLKEGLQDGGNYFWGVSGAMKKMYNNVHKVAYSQAPILITGECGCGKELLAKELHFISQYNKAFFISMDSNSLTDESFLLKLLGKVEVVDGQIDEMVGKLELAQDGTLFINNIEKLSDSNQKLLLNIIKTNSYKKINDVTSSNISIRFLFGSQDDLEKKVLRGEFNEELYNRISDVQLSMPSLRERREDILTLASIFLERYCRKYGKTIKGFTKQAAEFLLNYNWPGNVSELAVTIEKAVVLCDKQEIAPVFFQSIAEQGYKVVIEEGAPKDNLSFLSLLEESSLEQMEMKIIKAVLSRNRGNMSLTAQQLGITRQTLYNKGKRYKLID